MEHPRALSDLSLQTFSLQEFLIFFPKKITLKKFLIFSQKKSFLIVWETELSSPTNKGRKELSEIET